MPLNHFEVEEITKFFGLDRKSSDIKLTEDALGFQGIYYTLVFGSNDETGKCFIKSIPEGSDVVNEFYRGLSTFVKEVQVYLNILSEMRKFTVRDLWPHCYLAREGRFLVLEHMACLGWKTSTFMDFDHVLVAVECFAEFHAASLAAQEKDADFEKALSLLPETIFSLKAFHPGRQMWDSFSRVAETIVRRYLPKFNNVDVSAIFQKVVDIIQPSSRFRNCLNHGDPWKNNIFFRYSPNGKPCEASFVDFQSSRYAPPALDVSIFLNIFMPDRVDELATAYRERLVDSLKRHGARPLTKGEFEDSFNHYKGAGISIATLYIFLTKLPDRYLSKILISQETFIPFALGHDYSPALRALQDDSSYRNDVLRSLQRAIHYYS